ncbi:unnamed protein product [Protopolystoma xenopodis]|uniref:Uncharacterized protein n=1 Tax=Protopolystoma xenopodis TaxID=117903 RepID=A0A448WXE1_9PLAT|nr:unnamed protein product [Protopolystoma xenopodis]
MVTNAKGLVTRMHDPSSQEVWRASNTSLISAVADVRQAVDPSRILFPLTGPPGNHAANQTKMNLTPLQTPREPATVTVVVPRRGTNATRPSAAKTLSGQSDAGLYSPPVQELQQLVIEGSLRPWSPAWSQVMGFAVPTPIVVSNP